MMLCEVLSHFHNLYSLYSVMSASLWRHCDLINTLLIRHQALAHLSACSCQSERRTLWTQNYPVV